MRGASALEDLLAEFPERNVRVLVVWEPVLKTDFAAPLTRVLGLLNDARGTQYWDPGRVVSSDLVRAVNENPGRYGREDPLPPGFIAWDVVSIFSKSAHWDRDVPVPAYYGGPVRDVMDDARKAIAREWSASASPGLR